MCWYVRPSARQPQLHRRASGPSTVGVNGQLLFTTLTQPPRAGTGAVVRCPSFGSVMDAPAADLPPLGPAAAAAAAPTLFPPGRDVGLAVGGHVFAGVEQFLQTAKSAGTADEAAARAALQRLPSGLCLAAGRTFAVSPLWTKEAKARSMEQVCADYPINYHMCCV